MSARVWSGCGAGLVRVRLEKLRDTIMKINDIIEKEPLQYSPFYLV